MRAWEERTFEKSVAVPDPNLWTAEDPHLYKVKVTLLDEDGNAVDDRVLTTGIRTVSQEGGTFRINGKPAMLNGALTFGYRPPIEKIATWARCCPREWLVKEVGMIKEMNGNMMRVTCHQWAYDPPSRNINDPRLPEIGDQLGIMFMWPTTSWTRSEAWGVDFEGIPKYMKQVRNHPSIVMWEACNHPFDGLKNRDDSNRFVTKVYNTIYPVDQSRLITAAASTGDTLGYKRDQGGEDVCPAWTAPGMSRSNMEQILGYGADWSALREFPGAAQKSFLNSEERAYFNSEHQESIGQPNWSLVKGKPWYRLQSYEWDYDKGSIGRRLKADEWLESQAWQALTAYEATRKMRILDYDGFGWCCLHGGPNTATYKKPLIDYLGHAKLAWHTCGMSYQPVLAGTDDVDMVYGPRDVISPVIMNWGAEKTVDLEVTVKDMDRQVVDRKRYRGVALDGGRTVTELPDFQPDLPGEGYYAFEYVVTGSR